MILSYQSNGELKNKMAMEGYQGVGGGGLIFCWYIHKQCFWFMKYLSLSSLELGRTPLFDENRGIIF